MASMVRQKPTVFVVHGAWHNYEMYAPLVRCLEGDGYKCTGVDLPSTAWSATGSSPPEDPVASDVAVIRARIEPLADQGEDILMFLHSYAGIPGQMACKGLDKNTRAQQGKKGGVVKVIFCTSFALPEGVSLLDAVGGERPSWWRVSEDGLALASPTDQERFYNDLSMDDPKQAAIVTRTLEGLRPLAIRAFMIKNAYSSVKDIPAMYILCTKDNAIPLAGQEAMMQGLKDASKEKGEGWVETEVLDSSHSPFLSMPEATAKCVRRAAGESI